MIFDNLARCCTPTHRRSPLELVVLRMAWFSVLTMAGCASSPESPGLGGPSTDGYGDLDARARCDNDLLTGYDSLLVLAPHPDDETLGFAGLITEYVRRGKPVTTVVATDGDAYCSACLFWKNAAMEGETCDALELSNWATAEVDSLAEIRHHESRAAASILGAPEPIFLRYPDTGLAAAKRNRQAGRPSQALRRSDFSDCETCGNCASGGYGGGPLTELSATTLVSTLSSLLAKTTPTTLVATTHPLDSHRDHAALGSFVEEINSSLERPRALAYSVIHAHTANGALSADCWYPSPSADVCHCYDAANRPDGDPDWIANHRRARFRPLETAVLPEDADYGIEKQLCLPTDLYDGKNPKKLEAIEAYASQLGFLGRDGEIPNHLEGLVDCNGYLTSFVRRTEAFALVEP